MKYIIVGLLAIALAQHVSSYAISSNSKEDTHPHESSGQFQGDMKLTPHQWEVLNGNQDRNGVVNTWRWSTPTIPYIINPEFNETQVELILSAMRHIENGTCMRFVERVNQFGFIIIAGAETGCWSGVGFGMFVSQELNLQLDRCLHFGVIVHELLHAIGFHHMQQSTERDDFVTIMWDNILDGQRGHFFKLGDHVITNLGIEYDYKSIMHFSATAFSSNGEPTIVPHDPTAVLGQLDGLSERDIERINAMYCRPVPA